MKKILSIALLIAAPLLVAMGGKPDTTTPALTYGIVDTATVFTESKLGKDGFGRIQDLQKRAEAELALLEKRIDEIDEDENSKMMRKQVEMQAALYSLQGVLDGDQDAVLAIIEDNFKQSLAKIRAEKNIPIILAKETILSYEESADVTKDVIAILDNMTITFPPVPNITLPEPAQPKEEVTEEKTEEVAPVEVDEVTESETTEKAE